ncbi:MAG: hypothetical protein A2X48_15115 [Lentisphaerae bacterium GWF2_49_21]|nr:MAG: hypothetical protein A2X48_15115 [Lentisphaerae bacterium GWF2_49_21]
MKIIKPIILFIFLILIAGCEKKKISPSALTGEKLLTQLKSDLSKANIILNGESINIEVRWMPLPDAQNCQRRLDIYLADNRIGAFLNPIRLEPKGWHQEMTKEIRKNVDRYLRDNRIVETQIQVGQEIENYYE